MLDLLLPTIIKLVAPKAPAWVAGLIVDLVPAISALVEALQDSSLKGSDRFVFATGIVKAFLDDALDEVPEWSSVSEERRDRIVDGLVELVVFIHQVGGDRPRKTRRSFRKAWRNAAKSEGLE